jgi:hypothetical protein
MLKSSVPVVSVVLQLTTAKLLSLVLRYANDNSSALPIP